MPIVREHFRALPYEEVGKALATVEASNASLSSRLCLRYLVLTAARSGEARGATWDEIDMKGREWRIPGSRMKGGREHRVPLSGTALDVLRRARALDDNSGLVFPSALKPGRPLSDMTLTKILRSVGLADRATVHGFRTSFKTWAMERTNTPWAVGEAACCGAVKLRWALSSGTPGCTPSASACSAAACASAWATPQSRRTLGATCSRDDLRAVSSCNSGHPITSVCCWLDAITSRRNPTLCRRLQEFRCRCENALDWVIVKGDSLAG